MEKYLISVFLSVIFVFELYCNVFLRKANRREDIRFKFCELRRTLIKLVQEEHVKTNSKLFKFFFRFANDAIHYTDTYTSTSFDTSYKFLMAIARDERRIKQEKFINEILEDAKSPQVKKFIESFFDTLIYTFVNYSLLFNFLLNIRFVKNISGHLLKKLENNRIIKQMAQQYYFVSYVKELKALSALHT